MSVGKEKANNLKQNEEFYKKICIAYIDTVNLEFIVENPENNNSVIHGYFADDEIANRMKDRITYKNFKEWLNGDYYEYDTYEDFYEGYVKDEMIQDMEDIGLYDLDGNWDFYIEKEDLEFLGFKAEIEEQEDEEEDTL